jgi:hypothetical protein
MGYCVLGRVEDIYQGYKPRKGLEGPFAFAGGRVLYYDPREGAYWDPRTDFYVEQSEMDQIHAEMTRVLAQ